MKKIVSEKDIYWTSSDESIQLVLGDTFELLRKIPDDSIDMIFADPPYFLSNDGITCHSGKMVSVNKGGWDKGYTIEKTHEFNKRWLAECKRIIKDSGSIWISGTFHNIFSIGLALQELEFRIINDIKWYKRNAPPHLAQKAFAHATETIIWAAKDKKSKYYFDYHLMKKENENKQMRDLWDILTPPKREKKHGKHPTQKPLALMERIVRSSSPEGGLVLDPFTGSSSTGIAAYRNKRNFIGIDSEKDYLDLSIKRISDEMEEIDLRRSE